MNPKPRQSAGMLTLVTILSVFTLPSAAEDIQKVEANCLAEIVCDSEKTYQNPFIEVELDAVIAQPDGAQLRVPMFWAGSNRWCLRYASNTVGLHTFRTQCSDSTNTKLHGVEGKIEVAPYKGQNHLYRHGPIRVSGNQRYFEHADGTAFFWLGDTWWKCLCKRMTWEGFQELTADRKAKGFSVVQIVCGVYPDEGLFEPRWENEGGKPYETKDFSVVNPEYFKYSDRRIKHLADAGIVPAIVGSWGRPDCNGMRVGIDGLKRHWRNLIARYGAYPTIWIIGGESAGPQWTEVARYVRQIDPYHHPATMHPGESGRDSVTDETVIDFDMLQTGHGDWDKARDAISKLQAAYGRTPPMPAMIGEYSYEGHMQTGFQDQQRYVFWGSMLSGSAGLTYGAAGIWHASVEGDPGIQNVYDWTTWKQGMNYPGSTQLGIGKKLLEQYPWSRFEPHPEWAPGCFAAGIPGGTRIIYLPKKGIYDWSGFTVNNLVPGVPYNTFFFDPATGRRFDLGIVTTTSGSWNTPNVPSPQDWVLVMQVQNLGAPVILSGAKAGQAYSGRLLQEIAAFANRTGPGWLTIHPDGRVSGTPGESDAGGKVLLFPKTNELKHSVGGAFATDFWCWPMFAKAAIEEKIEPAPGSQGFLCDPKHPALAEFPTEFHSNSAVVADRQKLAAHHPRRNPGGLPPDHPCHRQLRTQSQAGTAVRNQNR